MNRHIVRRLVPVMTGIAVLAAAVMIAPQRLAPAPVSAQESAMPSRTITVVGEGQVRIQPDVAQANIGVEVVRPSVQEASAESRALVEAVLTTLQEQGIAERDIQTSGFSVFAERYGPEGPLADDQTRYRVSNNVMVTIRELDKIGEILDAAIAAGANNIYGVNFSLDEPEAVESQARAAAVENAQAKAQELAELTAVELGQVVRVSEVIGSSGGIYGGNFAEQSMRGLGGGGAPISPGELELTMRLEITYLIAQ